jgi:hypothetical protein
MKMVLDFGKIPFQNMENTLKSISILIDSRLRNPFFNITKPRSPSLTLRNTQSRPPNQCRFFR